MRCPYCRTNVTWGAIFCPTCRAQISYGCTVPATGCLLAVVVAFLAGSALVGLCSPVESTGDGKLSQNLLLGIGVFSTLLGLVFGCSCATSPGGSSLSLPSDATKHLYAVVVRRAVPRTRSHESTERTAWISARHPSTFRCRWRRSPCWRERAWLIDLRLLVAPVWR